MVELFNEDCLEHMKKIPDGSIDLCVTDPPYGISFDASNHMDNTDWDKMSEEKFYEFNKRWMSEVYRILKPTGTMWMFCGPTKIPEIFKVVEEVGFINHLDDWTIYARAKGRKSKTGLKGGVRRYQQGLHPCGRAARTGQHPAGQGQSAERHLC